MFQRTLNPDKYLHINLNENTYINYKSNTNLNYYYSIKRWTDLNDKERNSFFHNPRHYCIFNSEQFDRLLRSQQTLEDICSYFNLNVPELDFFIKYIYKCTFIDLQKSYSADFKVNLFNYALQMSQRSPQILSKFMDKYLGFGDKGKEDTKELPLPEQLVNLLEGK